MNRVILCLVLCTSFMFQSYLCQNDTDSDTIECLDNGIGPEDEPDDDTSFASFAGKLEHYTGLTNGTFSVTLDSCDGKICFVNPNGTAIWDARMEFYSSQMMRSQASVEARKTTLDGCLCFSTDVTDFQSCMQTVRQNMEALMDTVLLDSFKSIVESDCATYFDENCITA
ncbi:hypothetical protein NQ318_005696 [Aromia moschata]|uniref:Uncharacterized protein n=1 Tax=Aromia moschata TaxID=1265417 RepID=A0AAV8XLF0_9CUCU|nr:hypothetical protein NQ318_005696 [Aromia moschata]